MNPKLTIICPAIRSSKWQAVYHSIVESFTGSFELILITEADVPKEISSKENVNIIYSQKSPMAKQQQGLCEAKGEFITVVSDDSLWLPGTLDQVFAHIKSLEGFDYKTVCVMKYLEGPEFNFPEQHIKEMPEDMKFKTNYDFMRADKYYFSDTHDSSKMPGIPYHSPILSVALMSRELLLQVGGWDAVNFSSQAMGNVDLSARLMYHGCKFFIHDLVVSTCGYMDEATGDHGPIHFCQLLEDEPLLKKMFDVSREDRVFLSLDNWKHSDRIWKWKDLGKCLRSYPIGQLRKIGITDDELRKFGL